MNVLISLPDSLLETIEASAKQSRRSRKAEIENIILSHYNALSTTEPALPDLGDTDTMQTKTAHLSKGQQVRLNKLQNLIKK